MGCLCLVILVAALSLGWQPTFEQAVIALLVCILISIPINNSK